MSEQRREISLYFDPVRIDSTTGVRLICLIPPTSICEHADKP